MEVVEKVTWLMGRVQEKLFPHLNQCLQTSLPCGTLRGVCPLYERTGIDPGNRMYNEVGLDIIIRTIAAV
jgi:hypothetical protein